MTTNRDWLFSLPLEEQYAWMNAEHQERALDGDTDALERKSADLIHEYYKPMVAELQAKVDRLTAERDELKGQVFTLKCECEDLENELHNLTAERDKLKEQLRIGWECECKLQAERELYREALGKLIDTITEGMGKVSALLDSYDEGMA